MSKIRVLSDHIANQIAAGEVVERPASVAKELVENSIDAGARRVEIDVEGGGRRLLRVADDGEGMTHDDAVLAFERHATSKISSTEDLNRISTLGFRGEALASIASVARVELVTHREGAQGEATRVFIEGGRIRDVAPAARPRGTTITVRDLFFNVPARRKFLRSEATESFHLTNLITHYALAHPEIAFALSNNGRETLRAAPAADLRERAYQIFGADFLTNLLPLEGGQPDVARVGGYVSAPRERRTTRDAQYLFVNGRFVRDRLIARALSEGYRTVLPQGVYPAALLFLEVPLEDVDVNVHPSKTEVRFRRASAVADSVRASVRAALASAGYVRAVADVEAGDASDMRAVEDEFQDETTRTEITSDAADAPPDSAFTPDTRQTRGDTDAGISTREPSGIPTRAEIPAREGDDAERERNLEGGRTPPPQQEAMEFGLATTGDDDPLRFDDSLRRDALLRREEPGDAPNGSPNSDVASAGEPRGSLFAASDEDFDLTGETRLGETRQGMSVEADRTATGGARDVRGSTARPASALPPLNSLTGLVREVPVEALASGIRPLGQLEESFIVAADDEGLLLIDQHAAHERILFDKYRTLEATRRAESQALLIPETFDLSPAQSAVFERVAPELDAYGFDLTRLSGRTVAIRAVPADLPPGETRAVLSEVLDTVDSGRRDTAREKLRERVALTLARRAAVKTGTPLTTEKMRWLIERLLQTSSPTTCPQGRSVILRLNTRDIEKAFQRH